MKRITLTREDSRYGHLMLVSPGHPIVTESKEESGEIERQRSLDWKLEPVLSRYPGIRMEQEAAGMLRRALWDIGSRDRIALVSGHRSHGEQVRIWEDTMEREGEVYTRTYVARPGCSEHESGLAMDLAENREEIDFICPDFPEDGICGSFRTVAAHYGFIERYPAGKRQITGIGAEPWHFRYVGVPHAWMMKQRGLLLEEYLTWLREETGPDAPVRVDWSQVQLRMFYVDMEKRQEYTMELPDGFPCAVSGTNEGGIVVTLWGNKDA